MDRRSIITVILLTICFFAINYYFDMKRVENTREQAETEKRELAQQTISNKEIMRRIAPLKALDLTQIYTGETDRELIGYGYLQGDLLLTIQWNEQPPQQIYVGKNMQPALLLSEDTEIGTPILYATGEKKELSTLSLPQIGTSDVQVVSVNTNPSVYFGLYDTGSITFPGAIPDENCLVFFLTGGYYYAVGYYDAIKNRYIPLSDVGDDLAAKLRYVQEPGAGTTRSEDLYVLENKYLQLVISNVGGSLSEINLPLKGKEHPDSIVRPIQFDLTIAKKYPQNALFPEKPYFIGNASRGIEKQQPIKGGYYPLLRRGVHWAKSGQFMDAPIRYNGLNLVSDDPRLSSVRFTLSRFTDTELVLTGKYQGKTIQKRYVLPSDPEKSPYIFDYFLSIQGNPTGFWLTTGVPEVELISGSFMPALKYAKLKNGKPTIDQIKEPKPTTSITDTQANWISNGNGFFGIIIDPLSFTPTTVQAGQIPGEADPTRISVIDAKYNLYPEKDYPGYELLLPLTLAPKESHFRVFAGPFDSNVLKTVDATYTNPTTGIGPAYIDTQSFHGWFAFISEPFAKFLLILMNFFHFITGSWGISIILLTVALRIMLYPLTSWSIKSMTKMQEAGPKIARIKEKYKKDPKRVQMESMKIYKEEGGNPFSGCLPFVIQMPFLFGMFDLLKSSFELRGASFIPGWIDNLASPDVVFSWGYPIPFLGTSFHLLPIILGIAMYIQQHASQNRSKRKHETLTDQQKQQQQMGRILPFIFTVLFYKSPSGLNIYWIFSMGLSALQQWFTVKKMDKQKQ